MKWNIGNIEINNQVVLAPMAGISNPAFIKIVAEMGLGLAYTELISAEAIVRNNQKTFAMLKGIEALNIPVAIQLFGSNADTLAKAAKIVTSLYKNVFIDINMGCPVPKIALRSEAGSGLLKDPIKVGTIVKAVSSEVDVPVTVKIRSGWDQEHINALEIAKICEENGAKAISIHARTRSQGYSGKANWQIIKEVVEHVSIPVIGNGDVTTPQKAQEMLEQTGCTAVMIGRGVLGNPWLIRDTVSFLEKKEIPLSPTAVEKITICMNHLTLLAEVKEEHQAVLEIRNHVAWYLKGIKGANEVKNKIYKTTNLCDILQILKEFRRKQDEQ